MNLRDLGKLIVVTCGIKKKERILRVTFTSSSKMKTQIYFPCVYVGGDDN